MDRECDLLCEHDDRGGAIEVGSDRHRHGASAREGAAIVDAIWHVGGLNGTPIIVLSGCEADRLPSQTTRDANVVLVKPVLPGALLSQIRRLLAKGHELQQTLRQAGVIARVPPGNSYTGLSFSRQVRSASGRGGPR